MSGISFSISDEQRDFVALAHEFAERELRPIARAVDEADVEPQLEVVLQGGGARADLVHDPRGLRRRAASTAS